MNFSRISAVHEAFTAEREGSAMLGLPHRSIFTEAVKIGERTVPGRQLKWSVFRDFPAAKMYSTVREWVFPFIKNLHGDKSSAYAKYMGDAIFMLPTPLMLGKIVTALDSIYDRMAQLRDTDMRGTSTNTSCPRFPPPGLTASSAPLGTSSA